MQKTTYRAGNIGSCYLTSATLAKISFPTGLSWPTEQSRQSFILKRINWKNLSKAPVPYMNRILWNVTKCGIFRITYVRNKYLPNEDAFTDA